MRCLLLLVLSILLQSASAQPQPRIVNGLSTQAPNAIAALLENGQAFCSGVLIGCRTVLTAAHCVCSADGTRCANANSTALTPASGVRVYFQYGLPRQVERIDVHPDYDFGESADLALLHLEETADALAPAPVNLQDSPPPGSKGQIIGFGTTDELSFDTAGVLREGQVTLETCSGVPDATHLCWRYDGGRNEEANTCPGDSGGPLLVDQGRGLEVAGITSGGSLACDRPGESFNADVAPYKDWLIERAGADLSWRNCGPTTASESPLLAIEDQLNNRFSQSHAFNVEAGTQHLLLTLNALDGTDFDLIAEFEGEALCQSETGGSFESCLIEAPTAGAWTARIVRFAGSGTYQLTINAFQSQQPTFELGLP